jgi:hypothetical protein
MYMVFQYLAVSYLDIILISVFGLHPFTISRSSCLHWQRKHQWFSCVTVRYPEINQDE